jgi:tRNA(fMet)-specific endonuclease VapC
MNSWVPPGSSTKWMRSYGDERHPARHQRLCGFQAWFTRGRRGDKACPLIGISSIVVGELLAGVAVGSRRDANERDLKHFLGFARVRLFFLDDVTASHYASVYRDLRGIGHPIPTNDMWIAAIALEHHLALLSFDGHFKAIRGLVVGIRLSDFIA